ncbi:MAG: outer membrane protein OmpA-like peptidoglycan-associated protein [Cyclobacteriaceae bacterium]|jgi:outer membrane protein OmpA-like peptidoglycan-associated protein/tetratricopeptide (TPR) repeat protein
MADIFTDPQVSEYTLIGSLVRKLIIFCFCTAMLSASVCYGQISTNRKALKLYEKAEESIKHRDFWTANQLYTKAIEKDPAFAKAVLRLAQSHEVLRNMDTSFMYYQAYLRLLPMDSFSEPLALKMVRLFQENGFYHKADSLLQSRPFTDTNAFQAIQEELSYAIDGMQQARMVTYEELPSQVNSLYTQYFPTITIDESTLIFTARQGPDQLQDEDLMVSYFDGNEWSEAESLSDQIKSQDNEGAATISADGRTLIYTSCESSISMGSCDLFIAFKNGDSWSSPRNLGPTVNSRYWDSQPSLSADGTRLFFSSNRPGGMGGRDVWVSEYKLNQWFPPQNLGPTINSKKDEVTPFIHANNQDLFFGSNGRVGFGGFDLYQISLPDTTRSEVMNLGYGINDHLDQVSMVVSGDGKRGFFAQESKSAFGQVVSKLVRASFDSQPLVNRRAVYVTGTVTDEQSGFPITASIILSDLLKNEDTYRTTSDSQSGKYFFTLNEEGTYGVWVEAAGYLFEDFSFSTNDELAPDTLHIQLRKIRPGIKLTLENIFFEFDSYALSEKSLSELNKIAHFIQELAFNVEVSGHTDSVGDSDYNQRLSQKRAEAVYQYLLKLNVSPDQISFKGYGSLHPLIEKNTQDSRNRRIDFEVKEILFEKNSMNKKK